MISSLSQKTRFAFQITSLLTPIAYALLENRLYACIHRPIIKDNPEFSAEKFEEKFSTLWKMEKFSAIFLSSIAIYKLFFVFMYQLKDTALLSKSWAIAIVGISLLSGSIFITQLANQFYARRIPISELETISSEMKPRLDRKPNIHFNNQVSLVIQIALNAFFFLSKNKLVEGIKILSQVYAFHQISQMMWCSQPLINITLQDQEARDQIKLEFSRFFLLKPMGSGRCFICLDEDDKPLVSACKNHAVCISCFSNNFAASKAQFDFKRFDVISSDNKLENLIALFLKPFGGAPFNLGLRANISAFVEKDSALELKKGCPFCRQTPFYPSELEGEMSFIDGPRKGNFYQAVLTLKTGGP